MTPTDLAFQIDSEGATTRPRSTPLVSVTLASFLAALGGTAGIPVPDAPAPTAQVFMRPEEARARRRYKSPIESSLDRLKEFGKYGADWDSNGALAPEASAINAALRYLTSLQPWHPSPLATISREGEPILEFDDGDVFSTICFRRDPNLGIMVELYTKPSRDGASAYDEGLIGEENVNRFFLEKLKLPTAR